MNIINIVIILLLLLNLILLLSIKRNKEAADKKNNITEQMLREARQDIKDVKIETINYMNQSFGTFSEVIAKNMKTIALMQDRRLEELNKDFHHMSMENEQKLENIRETMSRKMGELTVDNNRQLEKMRETVDEKLQKTLEDRIGQSFRLVNERLEQVYKGLGEMQTLATGVGDLKKVLSNVKTRGILGEIQLGAILEQILSPDQYEENVRTKTTGTERVEYAVKLPGEGKQCVYLPIDAKFPGDAYANLVDAYEKGDKAEIDLAGKNLERIIKSEAKDIHTKYVEPPATTDFAIMFLPFEGLYAEVVRRGLVEELQRSYKVNIAGPTTMAALLNSLQMGFKTLAIQKHSSEVWNVLGAVKTEFGKFEEVLMSAQRRINQANEDLDRLVGTRSRMIRSKLRKVATLSEEETVTLFDTEEN